MCAVIPERHTDTRDGVENLKAANGLLGVARVPQTELSVAHAREAGGRDAVRLAHPHGTTAFCAWMSRHLLRRLLLSHVPYTQLLVSARGDQVCAVCAPRERLYDIVVFERELRSTGFDVPELDRVVAGCRGEDVLGGRVEQDVSDFAHVPAQLCLWGDVRRFFSIGVQREAFGHLPYKHLAIVRCGCNKRIVEGTPIGVEDGGGVPAEEGYLIGRSAALVDGDDGECATAASFPVDRNVLWICLLSVSKGTPRSRAG
jgi:hypothetical protein